MKFGIYNTDVDRLICDPIDYDRSRFADIIERQGGNPDQLTDRIDGPVKLGPLWIVPGREIRNPAPASWGYESRLGGWELDGERLVRRIHWQQMEFADAAQSLRECVASYRWDRQEGGITVGGIDVPTATYNRAMLRDTVAELQAGTIATVRWKTPVGWLDMTLADLLPLKTAVVQHIQACFARESALSDEIDAATTVEQLQAIDWQGGWP